MAVEEKDLMPRAFQLPEIDDEFKLDIPPTSGLEYLRRVQYVIIIRTNYNVVLN